MSGTVLMFRLAMPLASLMISADLQEREGTPVRDRIGFIDIARNLASERAQTKHPISCKRIRSWAVDNGYNAVVWTALGPRFLEKTGKPLSVDAAVRYLIGLPEPMKTLALEYIRKTPPDLFTPVRRKISAVLDASA